MAIYVDFDGTLATYYGWDNPANGEPIPAMVKRVVEWIEQGETVKIFTARVSGSDTSDIAFQKRYIQEWCSIHIGTSLEVTCIKGKDGKLFIDDRAVHTIPNTGVLPHVPLGREFDLDREIAHLLWTLQNHANQHGIEHTQVQIDTLHSLLALGAVAIGGGK